MDQIFRVKFIFAQYFSVVKISFESEDIISQLVSIFVELFLCSDLTNKIIIMNKQKTLTFFNGVSNTSNLKNKAEGLFSLAISMI